MATDPIIKELGEENIWLRELVVQVAKDLEAISSNDEYAPHTEALQRRAMRIRERLSEGPEPGLGTRWPSAAASSEPTAPDRGIET